MRNRYLCLPSVGMTMSGMDNQVAKVIVLNSNFR